MAHDLTTFVVPDVRLARAAGLDIEAAGLRPVATPRHATVLLVVGPIPDALASAVGVAYAQMPCPRSILAVGVSSIVDMPAPDVRTPLDQDGLHAGVVELRRQLAAGAFTPESAALEIAAAQTRTEYVCPMHPEIVRDEPGSCPICGMDLVPREGVVAVSEPPTDHAHMVHHPETMAPHREEDATSGFTCPMHPQIVQPEPGRCPLCGMNLVPVEELPERPSPDHGHALMAAHKAMDHDSTSHAPMSHGGMDHGTMDHSGGHGRAAMAMEDDGDGAASAQMNHAAMDHGSSAHAAMGNGEMNQGMMDHSMHDGNGFMSMVAMTRNLPRSADGLPMEWIDVPFGPLFPGVPGGLDVTFTLDGDGVTRAAVPTGVTARGLESTWAGPIETFPERLARVDPLAPVAYRLLARRALEAVAGLEIDESVARSRIREAEWERVGSHLGWLAEFGFLIGEQWIAQRAAALQVAVARTAGDVPARIIRQIRDFAELVVRMPLIDRRLAGIGETGAGDTDRMRGPVARAAGIATDARLGDVWYQALGFAPVVRTGGDALARLQVRMAEIAASLDLLLAATADGDGGTGRDTPLWSHLSGSAEAVVETPRGAAQLHLVVEHGSMVTAHLDPPSTPHIGLVPDITAGEEVADALVAVASLDLSPWEVDQ